MNCLQDIHTAFLFQRFRQNGLEAFPLFIRRDRGIDMEHRVNQLRVVVRRALGVVQGAVKIGAASIKGRKEKSCFRRGNQPVLAAVVKLILCDIIAQGRLCQLDGADAAKQIGINLTGCILQCFPILGVIRNVVFIAYQKNEIGAVNL